MTRDNNALRSQTAPIIRIVITGGFIVGVILIGYGLYLISQGPSGSTEISLFGQTFKSTNIGLGAVFLGVVLNVVLVRQALNTFVKVATFRQADGNEAVLDSEDKEISHDEDIEETRVHMPEPRVRTIAEQSEEKRDSIFAGDFRHARMTIRPLDDPVQRRKSLSDKFSKSLTRSRAFDILDSEDPSIYREFSQLRLSYAFPSWLEQEVDAEWIFRQVRNAPFRDALISEVDRGITLSTNLAELRALDTNPDERVYIENMMQVILRNILRLLPDRKEVARIVRRTFSRELIAAFLVNEYYSEDRRYGDDEIITMIDDTGTGAFTLNVLEGYLRAHKQDPMSQTWTRAIRMTKEVLTDDFEYWFERTIY